MKNFNRDFTAAVIKASEEWVARHNPTFDASHFENDEQVAFQVPNGWLIGSITILKRNYEMDKIHNIRYCIKRWLRWQVSKLGEYCNNNPYDELGYGLYLMMVDLIY